MILRMRTTYLYIQAPSMLNYTPAREIRYTLLLIKVYS